MNLILPLTVIVYWIFSCNILRYVEVGEFIRAFPYLIESYGVANGLLSDSS